MMVIKAERMLLVATAFATVAASGCTKESQSSLGKRFPAPGLVAMAVGNPQIPAPVVSTPAGYKEMAFYKVSIQGIPMGTAVFAAKKDDKQTEFFSEIKIGHRLGYAPLITGIRISALDDGQGLASTKQFVAVTHLDSTVFESEAEWAKTDAEGLKLIKGQPEGHLGRFGLRPALSRTKVAESTKLNGIHVPFFDSGRKPGMENLQLNPLTGSLFTPSEFAASFGKDGFAEQLKMPWFGGMSLEFKRENEEKIQTVTTEMPQNMLELSWFSTPVTIQDDLKALQTVAANGIQFSRTSEKMVRKEFPQLPYLFHRKLFNFNALCERIAFELQTAQVRRFQPEQALTQVGWVIRSILAEDHRELPRSLVNSPELEILADDSKKWQWARIISHMLTQTNEELRQVLEIEDSQKVNVAVRMNSRSLARGSVVKGMLRSGALHMHHQVESAGNQQLSTSSLVTLPMNFIKPVKVALNQSAQATPNLKATAPQSVLPAFEFINGQAFAKGDFQTLSPVCETYRGRVGLDLGNSKNELFSSSIVRGVWDESTRVQLIRQFARRASVNPACRDIVLRAPGDLTVAAKSELESFRKDILQTEMEFQISVGSNRSLRLVPGSYELVISSLVNGSILGKREIIIPQGHQNLVLNLQL
ncbi:MAG: hypothetical protein FJY29_09215 [Betaproteobacteria bacterium]|nr:hypothetical protein [Betaproteobacteria bacterium]